jgi:mannose-6-phosphate isomerase-like protein (cupin superfamily)
VVMVKGRGYLMMDNRRIDLSAGDIVYIPRGAVHYFVNTAAEPAVAFVIFAPPFDGKDTVPVEKP